MLINTNSINLTPVFLPTITAAPSEPRPINECAGNWFSVMNCLSAATKVSALPSGTSMSVRNDVFNCKRKKII